MAQYRVDSSFGWMTVIEAPSARRALTLARSVAESASLSPSDVPGPARPASAEDIAWYEGMCGET